MHGSCSTGKWRSAVAEAARLIRTRTCGARLPGAKWSAVDRVLEQTCALGLQCTGAWRPSCVPRLCSVPPARAQVVHFRRGGCAFARGLSARRRRVQAGALFARGLPHGRPQGASRLRPASVKLRGGSRARGGARAHAPGKRGRARRTRDCMAAVSCAAASVVVASASSGTCVRASAHAGRRLQRCCGARRSAS